MISLDSKEENRLDTATGWISDVYVQGTEAVVWIKTVDGQNMRLRDRYTPFFHVLCERGLEDGIAYRISECPEVRRVCAEELKPSLDGFPRQMIRVETWGIDLRGIAAAVKHLPGVEGVYNVSLLHVQRYLFTRVRAEPTSRVEVEYEGDRLVAVRKLPDEGDLHPPPFRLVAFLPRMDRVDGRWSLRSVRCASCGHEASGGGEGEVLGSFLDHLDYEDPDLVLIPNVDDKFYPSVLEISERADVKLKLGRYGDPYQRRQGSAGGRVFLGGVFYGFSADQWGVAGMVERARFSFAPIGLATRWLSNRAIDSRTSFQLLSRGHAVPEEDYRDRVRPLGELASRDKGGVAFTPLPGVLYENVAVLDFDSQYPSIMLKDGISYESPYGGGERGAILGAILEPWLRRRIALKRLRRNLEKGTDERRFCEERISAIKMMLVTIYGVSGCCRNRFGNALVFEEINRRSREAMVVAKGVADSKGYSVVYADVDSLFITRPGASTGDYSDLAGEISDETGLSISLDKHFRFLAFLRTKRDPSSAALKRYFGVTYDGEVEARGIEMRRGDIPALVRRFQENLIREVFSYRDSSEVLSSGSRRGVALLRRALWEIARREFAAEELAVRKRLGMDLGSYRVSAAQASAALQLITLGRAPRAGDEVEFICTDSDHPSPVCRVRVPELFRGSFDREYYARLLVRAARTIFEGIGIRVKEVAGESQMGLDEWVDKTDSRVLPPLSRPRQS